jgi:hypothetical protein
MKKYLIVSIFTILVFLVNTLYSHHAMEYIEMDSYSTAKSGEFVYHLHYDYMVDNKLDPQSDHYEITPGLSMGITNNLMFDIHCHFAKFGSSHLDNDDESKQAENMALYPDGPSPFIEAGALSLQYRIGESNQLPVDIAVSAFGEMPTKRAENLLNSEEVFGGSLILGKDFGLHNNITINLNYERDGDENIYAWALGTKFVLSKVDENAPAFGIEVLGDFEGHIGIMSGLYASIMQDTIFKTGIFIGLSQYIKKDDAGFQEEKEEDIRFNFTLMKRW